MNFKKDLIKNKYSIKTLLNKHNIFSILVILLIFFFDRISKLEIIKNLFEINNFYINDYINFVLVWNSGIGFGLLDLEANFVYHIITGIIIIVILVITALMFSASIWEKYFYSFLVGGALGNVYDRITYYSVPDFIDLHFKDFHWFTFNIADIFITIGILLLIIKEITKNEKN